MHALHSIRLLQMNQIKVDVIWCKRGKFALSNNSCRWWFIADLAPDYHLYKNVIKP